MPFAKVLENAVIPQVDDIAAAMLRMVRAPE
jgi:hypothetical protein